MLQQWLRQSPGAARFLRGSCCRGPQSGSLRHSPLPAAPHGCIRSLQASATESRERIPLRKQLKQDAKALKAQKRQKRESEEASRQKWELTVGIEIHAQLNTETKLFSSASNLCCYPSWPKMHNLICVTRSLYVEHRHPQLKCRSL
jgi:aspartyl-tRNA(Asn)/glutamyl-tRNA(Gln) amidotransferase subunit B